MPNQNGAIIEMYDDGCKIADERLNLDVVMVDGKGKGHLSGEYVVKARQIMSNSGAISLIFKVDSVSKELVGNIQIESRGFVYSSEVRKVHTNVVDFCKSKYARHRKKGKDIKDIMRAIKDELGEYVRKEIGREPMVVPMFVYITRDVDKSKPPVEDRSRSSRDDDRRNRVAKTRFREGSRRVVDMRRVPSGALFLFYLIVFDIFFSIFIDYSIKRKIKNMKYSILMLLSIAFIGFSACVETPSPEQVIA